jgi:hypothetical protein
MDPLTTVFEITPSTNGIRADALFRLAIGVVCLMGGIKGIFFRKQIEGRSPKNLIGPAFMTGWGILWLTLHIPLLRIGFVDMNDLLKAYHNGKSQVVEGVVHVSHLQPASGHSSGDKITVGGLTFEVNYFHVTPGYKQTISHGGVLREGVFARLHYLNRVILKVEIANQ